MDRISQAVNGEIGFNDLKADATFNEASFDREYESLWGGTVEDAFFNADAFDKNRVINTAESEASKRIGKGGYYVISVDVGRLNDLSDITIIKVNIKPHKESSFILQE